MTDFLKSIEHLKLSVFDIKCGDIVQDIVLFRDGVYDPHLEDKEIILIYWDKSVTDFSGYYKKS